jgi:hypothetical protein
MYRLDVVGQCCNDRLMSTRQRSGVGVVIRVRAAVSNPYIPGLGPLCSSSQVNPAISASTPFSNTDILIRFANPDASGSGLSPHINDRTRLQTAPNEPIDPQFDGILLECHLVTVSFCDEVKNSPNSSREPTIVWRLL